MRLSRLLRLLRLIQARLARANLSVRYLEKKQTNCVVVAEMAASMVRQPDVQGVWDGLTALHPNTDAGFRVQRMLHLRFWMYLDIWTKFRYALAMILMAKLRQISQQLPN